MTIELKEDFDSYFQDAVPEAHFDRITLSFYKATCTAKPIV